jgi:hypothetical protein
MVPPGGAGDGFGSVRPSGSIFGGAFQANVVLVGICGVQRVFAGGGAEKVVLEQVDGTAILKGSAADTSGKRLGVGR